MIPTGHTADRIRGLRHGADDYVLTPFTATDLVARVRALLRRTHGWELLPTIFADGPLVVNRHAAQVTVNGRQVRLPGMEWRLLMALIRQPGTIVTPGRLLNEAWSDPSGVGAERVKFTVHRLRAHLIEPGGVDPTAAVRGHGYRWVGYDHP